ncbi:Clp protease N-terminal domain-containing protein [Pseudonocardia nematodicida]|uniref:Clp protease N-terminal domain-containing protein n=1 Tax=Pseudonocardia nematodicida TaxID=1206997 RepID=A0ABV1KGG0_9PSEU
MRPPITPAHLLLGLLDQPANGALRVLLALDVDIAALRRQAADAASGADTSTDTPWGSDRPELSAALAPPRTPVEPTIMAWLHGTIYGSHLRYEYLGVLNMLAMAGGDERIPAPPDDVLISRHRELARLRTTHLQSELGFLDATARAGWTDTAVGQALAIPPQRSTAAHRAHLEAERDHHHPSRHPHPWTG